MTKPAHTRPKGVQGVDAYGAHVHAEERTERVGIGVGVGVVLNLCTKFVVFPRGRECVEGDERMREPWRQASELGALTFRGFD